MSPFAILLSDLTRVPGDSTCALLPSPPPSPVPQAKGRGGERQPINRVEMFGKYIALITVHSPLPPLLQPRGGGKGVGCVHPFAVR